MTYMVKQAVEVGTARFVSRGEVERRRGEEEKRRRGEEEKRRRGEEEKRRGEYY
jgi:translation initiation factor RLI1